MKKLLAIFLCLCCSASFAQPTAKPAPLTLYTPDADIPSGWGSITIINTVKDTLFITPESPVKYINVDGVTYWIKRTTTLEPVPQPLKTGSIFLNDCEWRRLNDLYTPGIGSMVPAAINH